MSNVGIFVNIQNFLCFQLSTAVAALSLITLSTALGLPNPLNAMQILFINVIMDGPPSQSLGVDPVDREAMKRPPRPKTAPILTKRLLYRVAFSASVIICGVLFILAREQGDGSDLARDQTMVRLVGQGRPLPLPMRLLFTNWMARTARRPSPRSFSSTWRRRCKTVG